MEVKRIEPTDTDFVLIKRLISVFKPATWGIITLAEAEQVKECLQLDCRTVLQLRNLRNTVVMMCDERSDVDCDWISAVTHVVDMELINRGAEV